MTLGNPLELKKKKAVLQKLLRKFRKIYVNLLSTFINEVRSNRKYILVTN